MGCLTGFSLEVHAQAPSAAANLATGISQVRAGEYFTALFTLNQVVRQTSVAPEDSTTLARAHAFRAMAYAGLKQLERARAAVTLALKADPNITVGVPEFSPATVGLFAEERRPVSANPETAGDDAEQTGRFQQAFVSYLEAFQSLPATPAPADDQRLREKLIRVVQKLGTQPPVPQQARAHLTKAQDLVNAEAILGITAGTASEQAATELRQAIRLAPWWPDAIFPFATVLQKLQRGDEALLNLSLYRLADPAGYAAAVNRANPNKVDAASVDRERKAIAPAVIYVYFPHASRGMGVKPKLLCDGQHVADLANGRFIMLNAAPGFHNFAFKGQKASATFGGGLEHYIRVGIEGYPAHFALRITDPAQAAAEIREKQVAPNDEDRTFSAECKAVASAAKP